MSFNTFKGNLYFLIFFSTCGCWVSEEMSVWILASQSEWIGRGTTLAAVASGIPDKERPISPWQRSASASGPLPLSKD